jgi:tRNA(Ile)-lysidine synthase
MSAYLSRFKSELARQQCADGRALIAVSGGRDSMTLAELCRISGIGMALAHFNHGLRGDESDADEALVREYAHEHNIPFYSARWERENHATDGESTQDLAHRARMGWLGTLVKENKFEHLFVAHHADDALETYLMAALLRGRPGALVGLRDADGVIRRPLLSFSSSEVEEMARALGVRWRDDSSNATVKYLRNRVRHHLVPLLRELNPGLLRHVRQQMGYQAELERAASAMAYEWASASAPSWHTGSTFPATYRIHTLLGSPSPMLSLAELFKDFEPHFETLQRMVAALHRPQGQRFSLGRYSVTFYGDEMTVRIHDIDPKEIELSFEVIKKGEEWPDGTNVIWVDADRIDPSKCISRPWREGDRMRPFGMKGWKLVSDLLTDLKVRGQERDRVRVLEQEGEIVWVIGHRADDRFRVPEGAVNVLEIKASEPTA